MNIAKFCKIAVLTAIALVVALVIVWGWQQGGLALLQVPGLC